MKGKVAPYLRCLLADFKTFCSRYEGKVAVGQCAGIEVVKRGVKIKHDEWSLTDIVLDTYTIVNAENESVNVVEIRTEEFRDNLQIFDGKGRELRFTSKHPDGDKNSDEGKENKAQEQPKNGKVTPYSLRIFLRSPLGRLCYETVTLSYTAVKWIPSRKRQAKDEGDHQNAVKKNALHRLFDFMGDVVPLYVNSDDLFWMFDLDKTFITKHLNSNTRYVEGGFSFTLELTPGTEVAYKLISSMSNLNNSADECPISNKMSHYFTEGEAAFFSLSMKDILDRLPKKDEDELPAIFVYMKIKPKMLDNVTLSSVQIVSYTVFAVASLTIHSKPLVDSLPLITALFIATLTLALFPRKSRLLDMRPSVFLLSFGLSFVLFLYFVSTYYGWRIVSYLYPKIISPDKAQILGVTVLLLILALGVLAFIIDRKRTKWFKCKEKQTECKSGTENTKS